MSEFIVQRHRPTAYGLKVNDGKKYKTPQTCGQKKQYHIFQCHIQRDHGIKQDLKCGHDYGLNQSYTESDQTSQLNKKKIFSQRVSGTPNMNIKTPVIPGHDPS